MVRRTTIRMEESLLDAAQTLGRATRRTLTAVIEDAVREAVAKSRTTPVGAGCDLPISRRRGGVWPGVALDQNAAVRDRMDGHEHRPQSRSGGKR